LHWRDWPTIQAIWPHVILCGYRGSVAHGTYEEKVTGDDKDIIGVFCEPEENLYGLNELKTVEATVDEKLSEGKTVRWDCIFYSIRHYMNLVYKQNPNVLSLLWNAPQFNFHSTPAGETLLHYRKVLLSRRIYYSTVGYARGQFHKMTHMAPMADCGAKRKELVTKFGYDVKNAAHLIRILKMGYEALVLGEMQVWRNDNNLLLDIKRGEWSLEKVKELAEELFKLVDVGLAQSPLPTSLSLIETNKLCVRLTKEHLGLPISFD